MAADPFTRAPDRSRVLFREAELAEALGVCVRTLHHWRKHQGLPFVSVNGRPMYLAESVTAWLKARAQVHTAADPEAPPIERGSHV